MNGIQELVSDRIKIKVKRTAFCVNKNLHLSIRKNPHDFSIPGPAIDMALVVQCHFFRAVDPCLTRDQIRIKIMVSAKASAPGRAGRHKQ